MKIPNYSTIAILGAGAMGAQIAAHFANAGAEILLFDLPGQEDDASAIAQNAKQLLLKTKPEPLASRQFQSRIQPCNYQTDLELLKIADLVIEAVAEKLEIKTSLFEKVFSFLKEDVIISSNTSGLSIAAIAKSLPAKLQTRFLGMHFFNPPRYLPLVELIAHQKTDRGLLDQVETYLTVHLGKTIIRAKDTPNFIANRIGVFSILVACHYAKKLNIPLEIVDQLTGLRIGRPKSATFRTADLVGLDVLSHAVNTLHEQLPKSDSWHSFYVMPKWLKNITDNGALGQKTKKGIYHKTKEGLLVWNIEKTDYRVADQKIDDDVKAILKEVDLSKRFDLLSTSDHPQAQFLVSVFLNIWHYVACVSPDIAKGVKAVDLAMQLGFGWQRGPINEWQQIGWGKISNQLKQALKDKMLLSNKALPKWISEINKPFHQVKAYCFEKQDFAQPRTLPIFVRQFGPVGWQKPVDYGEVLFENDGAKLWTQGDGITILSFKTRMAAISSLVLAAINESLKITAENYQAMIIYHPEQEHFSAGADLADFAAQFMAGGIEALTPILALFQQTMLNIRYAKFPVIAATKGYVLGGGCELQMHCDQTVAALESYVGLVELGVGLIPGAGGTKEMTLRASKMPDPDKAIQQYFKQIAMAKVATSAYQAKDMHYFRRSDQVIMNPNELLYTAKQVAQKLVLAGYQPPQPPKIKVAGRDMLATFQWLAVNLREGGFASPFDYELVTKLGSIMTGGDVDRDSIVDEAWLMRLERESFLTLVEDERTYARIEHMLTTGKPLRN